MLIVARLALPSGELLPPTIIMAGAIDTVLFGATTPSDEKFS